MSFTNLCPKLTYAFRAYIIKLFYETFMGK